jgi:hypothetical protein
MAEQCYQHVMRWQGLPGVFKTQSAIARPEDRALLKRELAQAECLGRTADGKVIYLWQRNGRKTRRCCASWVACAKLPFARSGKAAANGGTPTAMMTIICT